MKRRIDPTLLAIVCEGFFSRLSFGFISFALPLFAFQRMGFDIEAVGFVASANLIVAILLKPVMGGVADRFGRKGLLMIAILLRSVVSLMLTVASLPWHVFASRGVHGVSIAMRDPVVSAIIAERGGKKAIASSFAWYQTAKSLAGTLGKVGAGVLLTATNKNYTIVFGVAYGLSLIPALLVAFFVRAGGRPARSETATATAPGQPVPASSPSTQRPPVLRFSFLGFLISGTAYMLANLFPLIATEYAHLTEAQAGLIYSLSALPALMGPVFGWLSDHVSQKLVLSLRSIGNVFSSLLFLAAPSFAGMTTGRMMDDLGKAAFRPAWGAVMARISDFDPRTRARTMGTISAAEDAGEVAGPILAGLLWSVWGVPALLVARAAAAIGTEIYTVALTGSLKRLDRKAAAAEARVVEAPAARPITDATIPMPALDVTQPVPTIEAIREPVPASAPRDEVPAGFETQSSTSTARAFTWAIEWRSDGGLLQV